MTLAQYADYQRLTQIKYKSSSEFHTQGLYEAQMANESLPALPKGSNGVAGIAPDRF